jgi:hypothetical protein
MQIDIGFGDVMTPGSNSAIHSQLYEAAQRSAKKLKPISGRVINPVVHAEARFANLKSM